MSQPDLEREKKKGRRGGKKKYSHFAGGKKGGDDGHHSLGEKRKGGNGGRARCSRLAFPPKRNSLTCARKKQGTKEKNLLGKGRLPKGEERGAEGGKKGKIPAFAAIGKGGGSLFPPPLGGGGRQVGKRGGSVNSVWSEKGASLLLSAVREGVCGGVPVLLAGGRRGRGPLLIRRRKKGGNSKGRGNSSSGRKGKLLWMKGGKGRGGSFYLLGGKRGGAIFSPLGKG